MLFHPVRICKELPHSSPLHSDKQNTLKTRPPRKQKKRLKKKSAGIAVYRL